MTAKFLPIQPICEGKTPECLPRFDFPADFNVTFSNNHWSNTEKSIEIFEEKKYISVSKTSESNPEVS